MRPRNPAPSRAIWRRALAVMAASCATLAVAQLGLVSAVDPYRMFGTPPLAGLTALKPEAFHQTQLAREYMLPRTQANTVVLGNSRMEIGLDPASTAWPAACQPVFNAGEPGNGLDTALKRLRIAQHAHPPRLVVLAVDFVDTLLPKDIVPISLPDPANAARPFSTQARAADLLGTSLTLTALTDSLLTLLSQNPRTGGTITAAGFNPLREYTEAVHDIGYAGLFRQKLLVTRAELSSLPHRAFDSAAFHRTFAYADAIISSALAQGSQVAVIINPYHKQLRDLWSATGRGEDFIAFKRALALRVARAASGHAANLRLIDFSADTPYTTEAVPPAGDTQSDMRWYWEAGHFKPALGNLMIARITGTKADFAANFGTDMLANTRPLACQ